MAVLAGGVAAVRTYAPAVAPRPSASHAYYAAPNGSRAGDGSRGRPWDLATALAGGRGPGRAGAARVEPGDTIWVRGGIYRGPFRSTVHGEEGAPVVVRAVPGERAVIDGRGSKVSTLNVRGAYTVIRDLELTNSDTVRTALVASHDARPNLLTNNASHTRYINLVMHDGGTAIYTEPAFVDVEIAGCVIYANGWDGPDRGHGHGLYLKSLTGPLVARDNVIFNQYGYGVHAYSNATTGRLVNIRIEGNVAFNNGSLSSDRTAPNILLGGEAYATADVVRDNFTYSAAAAGANVRIGYKKVLNGDVQVEGNYFAGGAPVLDVGFWKAAVVTRNTFLGSRTLVTRNQPAGPGHIFHANEEVRRPSGTKVVVRPNPYEPGRAHAVVYNWARQNTVKVDLTGVLAPGDRYEIHRVQDLFGKSAASGMYEGGAIVLSMMSGSAPAEFDVFLVTRPRVSSLP
jgi:hypothetical protein